MVNCVLSGLSSNRAGWQGMYVIVDIIIRIPFACMLCVCVLLYYCCYFVIVTCVPNRIPVRKSQQVVANTDMWAVLLHCVNKVMENFRSFLFFFISWKLLCHFRFCCVVKFSACTFTRHHFTHFNFFMSYSRA